MGIKHLYQLFIMLFSEILWLYYGIVLFASLSWGHLAFFDVTWWAVAAIGGIVFNAVMTKAPNAAKLIGNVLFLGFIVIQNWRNAVPEEAWFFGIAVSLSISLIYLHSASFAFQQPKRLQVLHRFEGNIVLYILFAIVYTVNEWGNETFHFLFIAAIFFSLLGMLFTLSNEEQSGDHVEVRKVGQSSWFMGLLSAFIVTLSLICLFFLLKPVQQGLYQIGVSIWEGMKYAGSVLLQMAEWFFSLFPEPGENGVMPVLEGDKLLPGAEQAEATMAATIPIWLYWAAGFVVVVCIIWALNKLMKQRRIATSLKVKRITTIRDSWWRIFWAKCMNFFGLLHRKWRMRFSHYYLNPLYWYYCQVKKWGKKNGVSYRQHETSQEYMKRVIEQIPDRENSFTHKNATYRITELLQQLNQDFQAQYYGQQAEKSTEKYRLLIGRLKGIRMKRHSVSERTKNVF